MVYLRWLICCCGPRDHRHRYHMYSVEGRALSNQDRFYLDSGYALKAIFSFSNPSTTQLDENKFEIAFRQVVRETPILQTRIVKDDSGKLFFSKVLNEEEWPRLQVHRADTDDDEEEKGVMAIARACVRKDLAFFAHNPDSVRNIAIRMYAILGKRRVAYAAAVPHSYVDGIGLAVVTAMLATYVKLPRFVWWIVDRMIPQEVPNMLEMGLKKDLSIAERCLGESDLLPTPLEPDCFKFFDYDMATEGAAQKLHGMLTKAACAAKSYVRQVCR